MSFRENKGLWLSLAVAIIAVVILIWLLLSGGPRTLVVLFPDVGDLTREDPVVWHGYAVGRVMKIEPLVENQFGVTIRLNEDYAAKVTHGTRFTLKRAALFGLVGSNAIEIETPDQPGLPYADGERVQGISPPKPTLVEQGKQWTLAHWQQLKDQAVALLEEYNQSPYRKEVDDALGQIKVLGEEGAKQAKGGLEQFRKDHQKDFDSALRKLEQARDWIRKKGDEAGARRLQQQIDNLKK
jgi:ABC-type transporter Mla subunit MlaD